MLRGHITIGPLSTQKIRRFVEIFPQETGGRVPWDCRRKIPQHLLSATPPSLPASAIGALTHVDFGKLAVMGMGQVL